MSHFKLQFIIGITIMLIGGLYAQEGENCNNAIHIPIHKGKYELEPLHDKTTWYWFYTDSSDLNLYVESLDTSVYEEYILYHEEEAPFCENFLPTKYSPTTVRGKKEDPTIKDDFFQYLPFSREELNGWCSCHKCLRNNVGTPIEDSTKHYLVVKKGAKKLSFLLQTAQEYNDEHKVVELNWYEKSYAKGDKLIFDNILFSPGRSWLLSSSYEDLDELLILLNNNPEMKIEVGGHVNSTKKRNSSGFKQLSEERANTVKKYLVKKGITENRILYKGYGNTQMIFEEPENTHQEKKNRRVEITILSN